MRGAAPAPSVTDAPRLALRTCALAAVAALAGDGEAPELEWLRRHAHLAGRGHGGWSNGLAHALQRPVPEDEPLVRLAADLGLVPLEVLTVSLAATVESDVMAGRALAYVQAPLGGSRPTVGLLGTALAEAAAPGASTLDALLRGGALASGLLALSDGPPVPERTVSVPFHLCLALRGVDGELPGVTVGLGDAAPVELPPSVLGEARRHARGLLGGASRALVLRTGSRAEGRAVAAAIAQAVGHRPLFIETDRPAGLGPWLLLRRLLPVFCVDLVPGERRLLPGIPGYRGPVLVLGGPDGSVETAHGSALSWSLPVPPVDERERLWTLALDDAALAADLGRHYRHGSGRIAHLGRLASHRAAVEGRPRPSMDDVVAASWTGEGAGLDALAQPLTEPIPDDALVRSGVLEGQLHTLLLRCRAREDLARGLGASLTARYRPGVRALFVGPSGTGKTLAAGWLATRLALPLYRVDLASVTSKYIGETEKNLAQLLARAEQAEVVLLFDEADALFGKRTEVREANDRFANAQTNYLLQRIESFDGIALLTSNSRSRFDAAFARRLDLVIDFAPPGPEERRRLWDAHLGAGHALSHRQLNQLAAAADLCGGDIRNAVLIAAIHARAAGRPVAHADVLRGLAVEYRKLGRQLPAELEPAG